MNLGPEALLTFGLSSIVIVLFIGGHVYVSLWRQRRRAAQIPVCEFHANDWDFTVAGQVMATLIPTGSPEDPHNQFIIYDVRIVAGYESEVQKLLYHSNERKPDDAHICYHSLSGDGVVLKDSQVCVAQRGESRVSMKAYPTE